MKPFCLCNGRKIPRKTRGRESSGDMRQLKFKGHIESYLTVIETFNCKVCIVVTPSKTLLEVGYGNLCTNIHQLQKENCEMILTMWRDFQGLD